jgi:hypothetical protein
MKIHHRALFRVAGTACVLFLGGVWVTSRAQRTARLDFIVTHQFRTNQAIHVVVCATNSGYLPLLVANPRDFIFIDYAEGGEWKESQEPFPTGRWVTDDLVGRHAVVRYEFTIPSTSTQFQLKSVCGVPSFTMRLRARLEASAPWKSLLQIPLFDRLLPEEGFNTNFVSREYPVDAPLSQI